MLTVILLVLALVCFLAAAAGVSFGRIGVLPLGLALWVLASLLAGVGVR